MATTLNPPQPILTVAYYVDNVNQTVTLTTTRGLWVYYVAGYKNGAGTAGETVRVLNGAAAISNAIALGALGDQAVFVAGTIDDAANAVAAGGALNVTTANAGDVACTVFVECLPN